MGEELNRLDPGTDREARLRSLALRYRDPLVRYFLRRGLPAHAAEDCAHDVFVRIARADQTVIENAEAYLFTIAASVVVDRARRLKTRRDGRHVPIEDYAMPSGEASPACVFEGKEALMRLARILDELNPTVRETFLLNRLDGLSYTQLAARYGVNVKVIERRMSKALSHLRDRFPQEDRL